MKKLRGLGRLVAPADLLGKLRHDYSRITENPADEYAAFDFFVTAEHLVDWILPGYSNRASRERFVATNPLLQITSHIASGAKHFVAEAKRHQSVTHADIFEGGFDSGAFDPGAFQTDELFLTLEGEAAAAFGERIGVLPLADQILTFWEDYFARIHPSNSELANG